MPAEDNTIHDGDAAWEIIDQLATKYTGAPYRQTPNR